MGDRPVIGVTASFVKKTDFSLGPYTHRDYVTALLNADALPVILPIAPEETADAYLSLCDGIIFSGGGDVDPRFFGESPSLYLDTFITERDRIEFALMKKAVAAGKPILGICRGMQVLNVMYGGTLVQDLPTEWKNPLQHDQKVPRKKASHSVRLLSGSRLSALFDDKESLYVNSLHHQAIKKLAAGFRSAAVAPDGVIEAIEHETNDRILGVQWHPESMASGGDPMMCRLFRHFVSQCDRIKEKMV
ncbi:gamma-glutamyl-gamma-aminobutyrate hydrolase family protein [Sporolactobacillus sp. Y61]|uniref:Gamma-glutamyl-gamma-aminobutyrate hydrolase family protein n=1 Tax=Sporolactobacillus sp. Y61 TaxID=3160863 RepID=A0AAU8IJ24_9BACL